MTPREPADQPEWKQLEYLVADIQRQLAPDATVTHNAKLLGVLSETERQIDVLVEQNVGQYSMRIVIDCKDYARPIDVKGVEEFHGLMNDVCAQKGALVCPRGFTEAAKQRAAKLQVALYSPVDTDPHKWTATVYAPVVCDFRGMRISFGIKISTPKPFTMPYDFYNQEVYDLNGNPLGTIRDRAIRNWDSGLYPSDIGEHNDLEIFFDETTLMDNGHDDLIKVELGANLFVERRLYFGNLPIEKVRGFRDEHTGAVVANAFTTGELDAQTVESEWLQLAEGEEPPVQPMITIVGLDCYGIDA